MTQHPNDLETLLISKAMADEAFKSELISNPKAVIAREIGQEWPEGVEIEVLESTPKKLYLVLPLKVESEEIPRDELSDKELETVAGGRHFQGKFQTMEEFIKFIKEHGSNPDCDTHFLSCGPGGRW